MAAEDISVQAIDTSVTLDKVQLREVTLDDPELMQEILAALVDDTSQQVQLLEGAIERHDAESCMRLAHYSKGACANVGAVSAAALLKHIETRAAAQEFQECSEALAALAEQVSRLREAASLMAP
jgi:HPt (histidine-containing phosphotransfer) domain-containing protein